jgi:NhaP-type Na+/H+ or K+/H+ antiporter
VLLIAVAIVVVKSALGVSFLVACLIGLPAGWGFGILLVWLLGKLSDRKRPD